MKQPASLRDTRWDEPDTTDGHPVFPEGASQLKWLHGYTQKEDGTILNVCEERVAINKVTDKPAVIRQEGLSIIVPVMAEKMVLVKKLIIVEEIHLREAVENEKC